MIRILQTNLQRKARAHDMVMAVAKKYNVDVLMVSEPIPTRAKDRMWIKDSRGDVVVSLLNRNVRVKGYEALPGVILLRLEKFRLTACYLSPNVPLETYRRSLDEIDRVVQRGREGIVIGDMNVKSPRWGSARSDVRGEALVEWLDARDMVILSTGKVPTWRRGAQSSFIDVTAASKDIGKKISNWRVLDEESLSDHAYILFEVAGRRKTSSELRKPVVDLGKVRNLLSRGLLEARPTVEVITETLRMAQHEATVRRRGRPARLPYWWTPEIEAARGCVIAGEGV